MWHDDEEEDDEEEEDDADEAHDAVSLATCCLVSNSDLPYGMLAC